MARLNVPYLITKPGRGGRRKFFWQPSMALRAAGWPSQRLSDDEGQAVAEARRINDQVAAWRAGAGAAPDGTLAAAPGTVAALIADYRASGEWAALRPKTRRAYGQNLDVLKAWSGAAPVAAITPLRCKKLYQAWRARTPSKAAALIVMGRILWKWAVSEDRAATNPFKEVPVKRPRPRRTESDLWSAAAIAAFVAAADEAGRHSIGTAVMVNAWIGQRQGDVLTVPRAVYKGGRLRFSQSKTGAGVDLPVDMVQELRARLAAELARQDARGVTGTALILDEDTGQPYSEDRFRHLLADIRAAAADTVAAEAATLNDPEHRKELAALAAQLRALTFQLLRHTAVVRLAEAGVDNAGIASITGHSLQTVTQILEHYLIRTRKLARQAFAQRLAAERNTAEPSGKV